MLNQEIVLDSLKKVIYPGFKKDIVSFNFVKQVVVNEYKVALRVDVPTSNTDMISELKADIEEKLRSLGVKDTLVDIKSPNISTQKKPRGKNIAPNIKDFVMISSGKGGVGKSTVSLNLSISLAKAGKKVGLLDADIYGPNIPRMAGTVDKEVQIQGKLALPFDTLGIKVMSMGNIYKKEALIWRGPMIMKAIEQLLLDIAWGELDILVIDMPPGTGDAQITLAQSVPISAGLTVSTPQQVSLDDSLKSLDMLKKLKIPIAGVIENMSGFVAPDTKKEYNIFGKGTSKDIASKFDTKVVAQIPLEPHITKGGDEGKPISYFEPDSVSSKEYQKAANFIIDYLNDSNIKETRGNEDIQPVSKKPACSS